MNVFAPDHGRATRHESGRHSVHLGRRLAAWGRIYHAKLGIHVIWNQRIWNVQAGPGGLALRRE